MKTIDPDIAAAVRTVFEHRRAKHVGRIREKHRQQAEDKMTTQIELLADEVAEVIPPSHPAFQLILLLVVEGKLAKAFEEPEYVSALEEFPNGW